MTLVDRADSSRNEFFEISSQLSDRIDQLCEELLPNGKRVGGEWRVGSIHGETGKSLSICLRGNKRGVWSDFATGDKGDALGLVAAVLHVGIGDAMRWAKHWLGIPTTQPAPVAQSDKLKDNLKLARRILRESTPIAGTLGEDYLRNVRRINMESWPPTLRSHPSLYYDKNTQRPGIVCPVQNVDGKLCGIWRIFQDPETGDKAAVKSPRKGLGRIAGGAVRLTPLGEELTIGEGVETCLAALFLRPSLSVWAGLSASLMRGLQLPPSVRRVVLLEENDLPDQHGRRASPDAVRALAARFLAEGREVRISRPPASFKDMNDVLLREAIIRKEVL